MAISSSVRTARSSRRFNTRLAIAKHYKQSAKILVDINGYRKRKALTVMAKRLADRVKRTGKRQTTEALNPYERRIIHTLFKHNKNITTKSEGEGSYKKGSYISFRQQSRSIWQQSRSYRIQAWKPLTRFVPYPPHLVRAESASSE